MYRLQKIDELLLPSHQYLTAEDECFFFMNYTRLDQGYTPVNDLILNFKKAMGRQGRVEWKWKGWAIGKVSELFIQSLPPIDAPNVIFVPIPPSKIKSDPLYDDRIVQVLNNFCNNRPNAEFREIISVTANMTPTHEAKMSPDEILQFLAVNKARCQPQKENIVLVDDVITEGAHFKACQTLLRAEFPNSRITGLFIARTQH
jgi:hypothetical protein